MKAHCTFQTNGLWVLSMVSSVRHLANVAWGDIRTIVSLYRCFPLSENAGYDSSDPKEHNWTESLIQLTFF